MSVFIGLNIHFLNTEPECMDVKIQTFENFVLSFRTAFIILISSAVINLIEFLYFCIQNRNNLNLEKYD